MFWYKTAWTEPELRTLWRNLLCRFCVISFLLLAAKTGVNERPAAYIVNKNKSCQKIQVVCHVKCISPGRVEHKLGDNANERTVCMVKIMCQPLTRCLLFVSSP